MISFVDIFGQERAVEEIRAAYASERLPHGLIFAGTVGVGKFTTARALAALYLCASPKKNDPCGKCESCRLIESETHSDFHVIRKEYIRSYDKTGKSKAIDLSIKVILPELIEPAMRKPAMGHGKVFIIEQAELMNSHAQNAMLKTLEEPFGRTLIILLTDQPDCLLPTIRSRSQTIRFASLDESIVRRELERRGVAKPQAADAAKLSQGSLGLALRWIEDGVIEQAGELIERIDQLIKTGRADGLPDWLKRAADAYAERQLKRDELGSKDQATREGYALYLSLAANRLRQRLAESTNSDELDHIANAIDAIAQAESNLDANVNVALTFQQLAVALEREFTGADKR